MEKAIQLLVPKGAKGWITRTALVLVPVSAINVPAHYYLGGSWEETVVSVVLRTWLVALPFTLMGLALVSYLDRLRNHLAYLANTDMLTGLPNRRAFLDAATDRNAEGPGTLMMIDVDHFKSINDTFGHGFGDQCLIELGNLLRSITTDDDLVGRLGGEEFAIILNTRSRKRIEHVGHLLTRGFHCKADEVSAGPVHVTVSIGVARCESGRSISRVLADADEALYEAKKAGRAQMV